MKTTVIVGVAAFILGLGAVGSASAQNVSLTITTTGPNPGAVGAVPLGQLCNPPGGGTCEFTNIPAGTELRLLANSPTTPGVFSSVGGSASTCVLGTSTCAFVITEDSSATFEFNPGAFPSVTIDLTGVPGEVGVDNNRCQNVDPFGFSACTTYYGSGSLVTLQARAQESSAFAGYANGTGDAADCASNPCSFTLTTSSSVDAKFTPCKVTPSMFGQALSLNFHLGTVSAAQWNVWLSVMNTTIPLWSAPIPAVDPAVTFSVPVGELPALGTIGVLTTLVDGSTGITCSSWRTVETGAVPAAGVR